VVHSVDTADFDLGMLALQDFQHELELELRSVGPGFGCHVLFSLGLGKKIASPGAGALALWVDRRYGRSSP
jgi:hypothetical protein